MSLRMRLGNDSCCCWNAGSCMVQAAQASGQGMPAGIDAHTRRLPQAVQVMTRICRESEASLDYSALFKAIMRRAPIPMTPLESLASSAVRTAHKARPVSCALPDGQLLSRQAALGLAPATSITLSVHDGRPIGCMSVLQVGDACAVHRSVPP